MTGIVERLADANEVFTPADLYEAFQAIALQLGYSQNGASIDIPKNIETIALKVEGTRKDPITGKLFLENGEPVVERTYEHLAPVILVRAQTVRDKRITIPCIIDQLLSTNLKPTSRTLTNATMIAIARTAIVAPPGLVDQVLESTNDDDLFFFEDFYSSYMEWLDARRDAIAEKKSGETAIQAGSG